MATTEELLIEIGAKIDKLVEGVDKSESKLDELKEHAEAVGESVAKVGELFGIAFTADALKEFVLSMAELGEKTERTAAMLGISVQSALQLQGAAKLTGTDMDGLAMSIERMSLNIQHAGRDSVNPTAQALKLLGLSAKELIGLPADQYFERLAEAVSKFNPSLNLTNAVMQIGGRGIAQMIPMLQKGAEGYKEMTAELDEAQGAMAKQIPGMAETNEKINLLSLATQSLGAALFTAFKPAIDGVVSSLTQLVEWFRRSIQESTGLGAVVNALSAGFRVLTTAIASAVSLFQAFIEIAGAAFKLITFQATIEDAGKLQKALENIGTGWKKTFDSIWHDTQTLHAEVGKKMSIGGIDTTAKDQLAAQLTAIDEQVAAWKSYYEKLKVFEQSSVDTFKITEGQKSAELQEALSQRAAAVKALYAQEIALAGDSASKVAEIRKKLAAELEQIDKESMQVQAAQLKKSVSEWESTLNGITGAFNSQLKGLLAGTTTWAQAMKNITADLVIKMIEEFEKLALVKPLAGMLASTVSAPTELFASLVKVVENMFGPMMAGFTSFFAPTLGPAAPAAGAAAAGAEVAAAVSLVGKYEFGTDYVPQTGLALVHEGEKITPASQNNGSGGGHTFNISAWDAASVQSWLTRGGAAQLSRSTSRYMTANASSHG